MSYWEQMPHILRLPPDFLHDGPGVKAGQSLTDWERSGWIRPLDPRGWFQWYTRFYLGRRTPDDDRQISRWSGVCGANGRFKKALVKKVREAGGGEKWRDEGVGSVLRQTREYLKLGFGFESFLEVGMGWDGLQGRPTGAVLVRRRGCHSARCLSAR